MAYTIANLKDHLAGMLGGTDLSKVKNFYHLANRKAKELLSRIDPVGTKRIGQITNAIHEDIYDYTAPDDLKGDKVIDIYPQAGRTKADIFSQRFSQRFGSYLTKETFSVRDKDGTKILRLSASIETPKTIHSMESLTDNGTWSAGGDADNLTRDTLYYYSGSASLNFDLKDGGSAGYIENSTMTEVDLEDEDEVGSLWVRIYLPDPSIISSIELRWGNDTSNYWTATATSPHDQSSFKTGWNVIRFDWNGATETGTVDPSAIDYVRITVNYDGTAETDIRIDKITCSLGKIYEIEYYSSYMFQDSSGNWKENCSADSDIINLDLSAYRIYLSEMALGALDQIKPDENVPLRVELKRELYGEGNTPGLYGLYEEQFPSEALKKVDFYWDPNVY